MADNRMAPRAPPVDLVPSGTQPSDLVRAYQESELAPATVRSYRVAWGAWLAWHSARFPTTSYRAWNGETVTQSSSALPAAPHAVAEYIAHLAASGSPMATIRHRLAVISRAHMTAGYRSPTADPAVRTTLRGIARTHGSAQRQAAPLLVEHIRTAVHQVMQTTGPRALRDRALLLVGWSCGMRVSELVGLGVADLEWDAGASDGCVLWLRRSKTDQEGRGRGVRLAHGSGLTDPLTALREWETARIELVTPHWQNEKLRAALWFELRGDREVTGRPMGQDAVTRLVKRVAGAQGLSPARYSSHSLRRGLVTSLLMAGRSVPAVQSLTGHRSVGTVARYADAARLAQESPAEGLGL